MGDVEKTDAAWAIEKPRPWQRLSVRLAGLFAVVTLLAVGAVGLFTYERQQREVQDTVGTQLLNIARVAALLIDPALHAEAQRALDPGSAAYREVQKRLVAVQNEVLLTSPIHTLGDFDPAARRARLIVESEETGRPGETYPLAAELIDPLKWTFEDGVARYTRVYTNRAARGSPRSRRSWIRAGAWPPSSRSTTRSRSTSTGSMSSGRTIVYASAIGAIGTLILGLLFARRLTRPIRRPDRGGDARGRRRPVAGAARALARTRSAGSRAPSTRCSTGLRQRDFIRSAFGRYVSPEVAREPCSSRPTACASAARSAW